MELIWNHLLDWLNLLLRWGHFIVGVAWIGASFYFNWLENRLNRRQPQQTNIAGNLWAIHGGGFYHLNKLKQAPEQLPEQLHWFKWEAYATWITGFCLLCVVYYFNAEVYLVESAVDSPGPKIAILIGLTSLLVSWLFYDCLCKSALSSNQLLLAIILFSYFMILAIVLNQSFSARAAYIHIGAAVGTIMVANVFFVIIPSQKELVRAVSQGREPQISLGEKALLRSRHNNYLTLPVLFMMISAHYPMIYGHAYPWLVLATLSLGGIFVRHYFNIRHLSSTSYLFLLFGVVFIGVTIFLTAPIVYSTKQTERVSTQEVHGVITQRCASCHSEKPTQPGFSAAPAGLLLQTHDQIEQYASEIYQASVLTRTMPLANLTEMTDKERELIGQWYNQRIGNVNND